MSLLRRLFRLKEQKGAVATVAEEAIGKGPSVALSDQVEYYLKDSDVKHGIDWLSRECVGMGFYTTAETARAKEVVDDFNEEVNLDEINLTVTREAIGMGNSFVEKIEPNLLEKLTVLPLSSFKRIPREIGGKVKYYDQRWGGKDAKLEPERIIHFRWNPVDAAPFGTGLLSPLAESREYLVSTDGTTKTKTVPPLLRIKWQMEDDMRRILHRYLPRNVYVFEGASDNFVDDVRTAIKNIEPEQDFVVNQPLKIAEVAVDPRARFETYTNYIENRVISGLQTAIIKLLTTPGFTEASATQARLAMQPFIRAYQRFHKRIVERMVFKPVVEQAGLNWQRAKVRLNWGVQELPKIELEDLYRFTDLGVIRVDETRKALAKMGFELWEPEAAETPEAQETARNYEKLRNLVYQSHIHGGRAEP